MYKFFVAYEHLWKLLNSFHKKTKNNNLETMAEHDDDESV